MLTWWIKKLLKKILPPPVNTFNREVERILDAIGGSRRSLEKRLAQMEKENQQQFAILSKEKQRLTELLDASNREKQRLTELLDASDREKQRLIELLDTSYKDKLLQNEQQKSLKYLVDQVNQLMVRIPNKNMYNNDYERRVIANYYDAMVREDFETRFLSLIRNLDAESAETVTRILSRQQKIKGTEGKLVDLFTTEEQHHIQFIKEHFQNNIFEVSPNVFCYKNYLLPINHFEASVFVDQHGLRHVENLEAFRDKCILDVGGFVGDSALIFAPLTEDKVYTFEAVSEHYDLILKTIKLNNLDNVVPVKAVLGAEHGQIAINIAGSSSSIYTPNIKSEAKEIVEMITLDEFITKNSLNVGLIKVDIEGFEQSFLTGAEQTIKSQRPTLLLSIYHNSDDFFDIKPLIESWNLGYKFKVHKPIDFSISREVLLIAEVL
ncbi:methyltransferase, FkbM family [Desulfotomaculum arcticum]|uniref:Methyltransferase, FkbM family n=1 Tax=Desulfotruncus arcticus DSM 17038 TaxID=1121424 RepID=A0A1I2WZR8_9FIRM|nr:FkbM family methyltransferase [Desulfotruncus arcticus]SFH06824.1 methyltransferase, FkbM family [Desulfotomaculum arcticum] [Desulfotruncus arcticus DSM 17038]